MYEVRSLFYLLDLFGRTFIINRTWNATVEDGGLKRVPRNNFIA